MREHMTGGHRTARQQRSGLPIAVLFASTMLQPMAVHAQSAPPADDDTARLEEIVVTAQRRAENLQDTPLAVTAFSAATLAQTGIRSAGELAHVDPSLNIQRSAGVYIPFLRGIGNGAATAVGNEASVPVYIDDVYYTRLSSAYLGISSVERVEILKGPQGTLFGRNSSGGAIQIFTRDPGRDATFEGSADYANYDTISGKFYASTPLGERLSWNMAAAASDQRDGWGKNQPTGKDAYKEKFVTLRTKLLWEATETTRVRLAGFYVYQKGDIGFTQDRHRGSTGATPPPVAPGYPNPPQPIAARGDLGRFYDTNINFGQYQREEGYGGSARIDQETGFAEVVSITAFRRSKGHGHYDSDYSPFNFLTYDLNNIDRQFSQEFQLKSKSDSKVNWIAGVYYLRSVQGYQPTAVSGDALNVAVAPGAVQNLISKQVINSYSAYGQATIPLGAQTNLTAGLRYTEDRVRGDGAQNIVIPGGIVVPLGTYGQKVNFHKLTYKAAIDHHFSDDVMAYASVSRGYKSGTFNTLPLDRAPARAEVVDAYEAGLKTELFDRRVRINGALFWNDIKSPQVLTIISTGAVSAIGLTNAEKARVKGGEIGVNAVAAPGLTLRASATYLDGKFVSFKQAPYYFEAPGGGLNPPVLLSADGNRLPRVPKWRADLGVNYSVETGAGALIADISLSHSGSFAWDADNLVREKDVTLINASLNFSPAGMDWLTIGLWGKNLGDVQYYSISQPVTGGAGEIAGAAAPRTYGATIGFKF